MTAACRVTTRGWVVLGCAAAMALAGYLFGLQELFPLAASAAALVVAARAWVSARRWDLGVARQVHPSRVPAGGEARVELAVHNPNRRRTPPISAADPFDGGQRWARFAIAPLEPGADLRTSYRIPTARRGVYHLGPLELRVGDPFGLAESLRYAAPDTSLTVHPRVERLSGRSTSSHRGDDRLPVPVIGRNGSDLYALRRYVPGDDLRHVHWPSTARVDDLVVRQPERLRRGRLTVAADLRGHVHDAYSIESVLSATASVALSSLDAGLQVRVVTTAGLDTGHGSGPKHGPAVLDGLAAAGAHRSLSTQPFRMVGTVDPVVLVTTGRASDSDLRSAFRLGGPSTTSVVVFEVGQAPARPVGRGRVVRVPRGGSFKAAWESAAW